MPKPFAEYPGSAMHTHMSLFEGETNAFHSPDDPLQLSDVAKSFIAGILEHASEISAVTNQWVNSYKRLVHGGEAPTAASWGAANRSALVRVPMYTPRKAASRRIEVRSPDSACNPYLTFAVLLAAGLRGIEKNYVLGPQAEDNVWTLTPEERRAMGYRELPSSLGMALGEMENSELVAEALGEHVFDYFLRNKRAEWEEYRSQRHAVRAEAVPVAVAGVTAPVVDRIRCDTVMGVAKPATQRPRVPERGSTRAGRAVGAGRSGPPGLGHRCARRVVVVAVAGAQRRCRTAGDGATRRRARRRNGNSSTPHWSRTARCAADCWR